MTRQACRILVSGQVQGVGFRPFLYRLAHEFGIGGSARNLSGKVEILAEGSRDRLDRFVKGISERAPPLARPVIGTITETIPTGMESFAILPSEQRESGSQQLPPDLFVCSECLTEMDDPANRRFRYPFINCTQCGPRYTIIEALPYDRPLTSMSSFPMCGECQAEYENPLDRRFHAQPIACPQCGPKLELRLQGRTLHGEAALKQCVKQLRNGNILAVKGIGGYHLMCDAGNDGAVTRLRKRKRRPAKPLAVMFPMMGNDGLAAASLELEIDPHTAEALLDPRRPIVLVPRKPSGKLCRAIAPGLREIGAIMPYSPLHALLLGDFGGPLVATSANISGEPVLTSPEETERRLGKIADGFLHHNRPIVRPADDSVVRPVPQSIQPIRLGRGYTPLELPLIPPLDRPVLALGGFLKVALALGINERLVMTSHIGDLGSERADRVIDRLITDLPRLYGFLPEVVLCDAHPNFASQDNSRLASVPLIAIPHHFAHASALALEHPDVDEWLVFAWDGIGFGPDGSLWGGEALSGNRGAWRRMASWRKFFPVGRDKVGREPWRSAAAMLWAEGLEFTRALPGIEVARQAWERRVGTNATSAVGRIFDAAAALVLGLDHASYEGQGPMELEAAAGNADFQAIPLPLPLRKDNAGLLRSDWAPLLSMLTDETKSRAVRAACFHSTLARAAAEQVSVLRETVRIDAVGLTGGVFQNRLLTRFVKAEMERIGLPCRTSCALPCNDGGIAAGQIAEYAALREKETHHA